MFFVFYKNLLAKGLEASIFPLSTCQVQIIKVHLLIKEKKRFIRPHGVPGGVVGRREVLAIGSN